MAEVKVYYDQEGNTLTVWFGQPTDEYECEETTKLTKLCAGHILTANAGDKLKLPEPLS